jgi:hypothetical protein
MRFFLPAFIAGAASALELDPEWPQVPTHPDAALSQHWANTGTFLWHGVDAQRPQYEAQRPLFDSNALSARQ